MTDSGSTNNNPRGRSQQGHRRQGNRGQGRGTQRNPRYANNNSNNRNKKTYFLPDLADKELGDNVFIVGAEAANKFHKTKLAIINHIQKNFAHSDEIKKALKNEEEFDFEKIKPTFTGAIDTTTSDGLTYKLKLEKHLNKISHYESNKSKAYAIIHGQCTQSVKNRLEADPN